MTEYRWSDFLSEFLAKEICVAGLEVYYEQQQPREELKSRERLTFLAMFSTDEPHGFLKIEEICKARRNIAPSTVKGHCTAIYFKFGLTQRDEDDRTINPHRKPGEDLWLKLWEGYRKRRKELEGTPITLDEVNPDLSEILIDSDTTSLPQHRTICGSRPIKVYRWVGREELLKNLYREIDDQRRRVIILHGQCGMGKTTLATKLLEKCGLDLSDYSISENFKYYNILHLKAKESWDFYSLAEKIFVEFKIEPISKNSENNSGLSEVVSMINCQKIIDSIIHILTIQEWLVLIDNLDILMEPGTSKCKSVQIGKLLNQLAYENHSSQIIITSQKKPSDFKDSQTQEFDIDYIRDVAVEGLSDSDSIQLLKDLEMQDTEEDLKWIAERVNGNPKILELLARYAANRPGLLRSQPELVTERVKPIIEAQLTKQGVAAQELLKRMCVLRIGMDVAQLNRLRSFNMDEIGIEYHDKLNREINTLLDELVGCGLIDKIYDTSIKKDLYSLHSLIVETLQDIFGNDLKLLWEYAAVLYDSLEIPKSFDNLGDLRFIREKLYFWWQLEKYEEASETFFEFLHPSLQQWGYWGLVKEWCEEAIEHTKDENYRRCIYALACIYRDTGKWDMAEEYFNTLLTDATQKESSPEIARLVLLLAGIARRRGHWDQAEQGFRQSLDRYTELEDSVGIANCLVRLGNIDRNRGYWDLAKTSFDEALKLRNTLEDRLGIASCWGFQGDILRNQGDWDGAEKLYEQSLKLHQELKNLAGEASCLVRLGTIARKRANWGMVYGSLNQKLTEDDWDPAENYFQTSLKLRTRLGDRSGKAMCLGFLGDIARQRGDWAKADKLIQEFFEIADELGDRLQIAIALRFQGENELAQGNVEAAEISLTDSLAEMEYLKARDGIAKAHWALARLERAKGNEPNGSRHYVISRDLFTELGAKKDLERIACEWNDFSPCKV